MRNRFHMPHKSQVCFTLLTTRAYLYCTKLIWFLAGYRSVLPKAPIWLILWTGDSHIYTQADQVIRRVNDCECTLSEDNTRTKFDDTQQFLGVAFCVHALEPVGTGRRKGLWKGTFFKPLLTVQISSSSSKRQHQW